MTFPKCGYLEMSLSSPSVSADDAASMPTLKRFFVVSLALALFACSDSAQTPGTVKPSNTVANNSVDLSDASSPDWPFGLAPELDPMDAQPEALGGGNWELQDGCLTLGGFPVVLPNNDTNWDAETQTLRFLGKEYLIGSEIYVNGGYSHRERFDRPALLRPVPTSCKGDEVFRAGTHVVRP